MAKLNFRLKMAERLGLIGVLTAAISLGAVAAPAFAGTATSQISQVNLYGVVYQSHATIVTSSGTSQASTTSGRTGGSQAGSGWIGVNGRSFDASNNALRCESGFQYTTGTQQSKTAWSCQTVAAWGYSWYSYGVTRQWNGNGYNNYYTFKSPNQNS